MCASNVKAYPLQMEKSLMRFGLQPLAFEPIVGQILVNGVADFSRFTIDNTVRQALKIAHMSAIEVTMDIERMVPGSLTPESVAKLASLKEELGNAFTVHLPFYSLELASFNEHIRQAGVETVVQAIELAGPLEPEAYVLHTTGALAAEFSQLDLSEDMVALICGYMSMFAARSLEEIITRTEIHPRKIAVENVQFPFGVTYELVEQYNTSICFDTGHLLSQQSGTESVIEFYRRYRERIVELHLHDGGYEKRDDIVIRRDHIPLGRGVMPVRDFLRELLRSKFNGPIIFEMKNEWIKESLDYIHKVIPEALT